MISTTAGVHSDLLVSFKRGLRSLDSFVINKNIAFIVRHYKIQTNLQYIPIMADRYKAIFQSNLVVY